MAKGFTFDIILIIVVLFVLGLTGVMGYHIATSLGAASSGTAIGGYLGPIMTTIAGAILGAFDSASIVILVLYLLVVLATSYYIFTSPLMFFISFIVMLMSLVLSMLISNIYGSITSSATLATSAAAFTYTIFIMANLPYFVLAMYILTLIYFYSKGGAE